MDFYISGSLPPPWGCPAVGHPKPPPSPRGAAKNPSEVVHAGFAELPLQ